MLLLAMTQFDTPLVWAVLIGWILSVTIHEFAHGLAAHLGGDYTIAERGGLTLNPLQYIDPLGSIIFPAIILLIGGIPLPGGMTFVRNDLLRGRHWEMIVAAAGPAANFALYLILSLFLLPGIGWLDADPQNWTTAQKFVGAMAALQLLATVLNLLPIPPLDGFRIISPWLPPDLREKLMSPGITMMCYFGLFLLLTSAPLFFGLLFGIMKGVNQTLGFGDDLWRAYIMLFR
jgi:Zn-dependent protease